MFLFPVASLALFCKLFELLGIRVRYILSIDNHHRTQGAASYAIYCVETELLIICGLSGSNPERLGYPIQKLVGATHMTCRAKAH